MLVHQRSRSHRRRIFGADYLRKVLSVERENLIGCWLQNEGSGSVSYDLSGQGNNGAYTGVTLGQSGVPGMGMTSPLFDGANDFNNIYSAGLNADFDGAEGTLLPWAKVSGAGVWTDGATRYMFRFFADVNNYVFARKETTNNTIVFQYNAGGTPETEIIAGFTSTDFICPAITWSKSAIPTGEVRYYIDGAPSGATDTALGTWVGNLDATRTILGAPSTVPANVWSGNIGPVALWNKALTAAQIAYLSTA